MEQNYDSERIASEQEQAFHLLLTEFVRTHADEIARSIEPLIRLFGYMQREDMQRDLTVINYTVGYVALETMSKIGIDSEIIPIDSKDLQSTMFEMMKMVDCLSDFGFCVERNQEQPAFSYFISKNL